MEDRQVLKLLDEDPKNLSQLVPMSVEKKRIYVLIDEIQYIADPSNFLKYHYDTTGKNIKFIVSGSSHFYLDKKFRDSMAGRKRVFYLPTLSLEEVFRFQGKEELSSYLGQATIPMVIRDEMMVHFYDYLVFGGYPDVVLASSIEDRKEILRELRDSYAKKDAEEAGLRQPGLYMKLLTTLADQTGALLNVNSLSGDLGADGKTLKQYLSVMEKSFHIHTVSPFYKKVASELRKMPKVYFGDLGFRNCLLNNFSSVGTRTDKGALLENYIYLRLRQKYDDESIKYWRTQNRQEVDFVVQNDDGTSAAYEVKFRAKSFQSSKYDYFRKTYPETPLECVSTESVLGL
jgi:predicted AAA+ superfamily ATPase